MPLSAWITCAAVSVVLYGGFLWCLSIAIRKGRESKKGNPDDQLD